MPRQCQVDISESKDALFHVRRNKTCSENEILEATLEREV